MTDDVLVGIREVSKSFGGSLALDGVSLDIGPHEVHGLLGENGSGKSTLIKVLSGFHEPDSGTLTVRGAPVSLPLSSGRYRELGFEFVHQDLGLIPSLSVAENLFLYQTAGSRALFASPGAARREAQRVLASHGVALDSSSPVESIRPVDRAMLAIIRAIENLRAVRDGAEATLLVLDEPTVFLPQDEVDVLFGFVRSVVASGASVLFVSHDLDEVLGITDKVTVLRDGVVAGTVATSTVDKAGLVEMIIGHQLSGVEESAEGAASDAPVLLSVEGLSTPMLAELSFEVRAGEVLGFAGLVGSGYEDVVYALFGASTSARGSVSCGSEPPLDLARQTPTRAVREGFALVPADRKNTGSIGTLSASDNINMTVLDDYFRGGILRHRHMRDNAVRLMEHYDVRPRRADLDYGSFSGGNQQKAMLAKWQQTAPKVLLVHEPTQGVDVGAREQIHELIRANASTTATVCASSDYEQLAELCDRVGIIVRGRLTGFLSGDALTKAAIADRCHGRSTTPHGLPA